MDQSSGYNSGTSSMTDRLAFFLFGAAIGALVATVVTILFAPQSGQETREFIAVRSRQLGERARSGGDEFIHRVGEATDEWAASLQAAADDLVAQGRMSDGETSSQIDE